MQNIFKTRTSKVQAAVSASLVISTLLYVFSPLLTEQTFKLKLNISDISDILLASTAILHILWFISLGILKKRKDNIAVRLPEFFTAVSMMFFLFNYLFAANAGLEYVQRFAQTSDVLSFAPDTGTERLLTFILFLPFICADIFAAVSFRAGKLLSLKNMRLPLTLLSALLYAFSFPSFLDIQGWGFLIFIAFIPLLAVIKISSIHRGIFYGIVFGIFQTMIINYWLATFSLVSLQFVTVLYTGLFTFFMIFTVYIYKKSSFGWILFPVSWIVFEWARSSGFSAYPWCLRESHFLLFL
jgi:apolipoprotein N-acyltransferase